jgi:hypothetical protein
MFLIVLFYIVITISSNTPYGSDLSADLKDNA